MVLLRISTLFQERQGRISKGSLGPRALKMASLVEIVLAPRRNLRLLISDAIVEAEGICGSSDAGVYS